MLINPGALFHERYRVVRCIGTGGQGAVYEVTDELTDRRRALKVMLPMAINDPQLRARFAQEAKITGPIESDHLVPVSDAGIDADSGMPFLVMDLLQGVQLGKRVAERGALPATEVALYLQQVVRALEKTHAAGIVHRDLKPENLFVITRDDGTPCVKILDFGVAKMRIEASMAQPTALVGTPLYMAPEQVHGDGAVGPPADIYALGQVAFTLLTGEAYWMPEARSLGSVYALFQKVLNGPPEAASLRARRRQITLPPGFDDWFRRVTAQSPRARPDSALTAMHQLLDALDLAVAPLTGRSSTLPPPASARRPQIYTPQPPTVVAPPPSRPGRPTPDPFAPTEKPLDAGDKGKDRDRDRDDKPRPSRRFFDTLTKGYTQEYLLRELGEKDLSQVGTLRNKWAVIVFQADKIRDIERAYGREEASVIVKAIANAVYVHLPRRALFARCDDDRIVVVIRAATAELVRDEALDLAYNVRSRLPRAAPKPIPTKLLVGIAVQEFTDASGLDLLERATQGLRELV